MVKKRKRKKTVPGAKNFPKCCDLNTMALNSKGFPFTKSDRNRFSPIKRLYGGDRT